MVLPVKTDVEHYIMELKGIIEKLTDENEAFGNKNESLKKKFFLYENPHCLHHHSLSNRSMSVQCIRGKLKQDRRDQPAYTANRMRSFM